ncbi:UDP-galactopyranose mutase [Luteolibacter sp. Populi]|uniref:UDP-galactopyranose/dTDP-fucopyranose mutase family protein n=1 Tax=Luteolibacter sp. Populi TaxID=3230487 RepID=UPI003467A6A2
MPDSPFISPPRGRVLIVGAGFSGAVLARYLAEHAGLASLVIDERPHVAGNCHTERDEATGVMLHKYGPHIFHTDNEAVWSYIRRFSDIVPYRHRVKATIDRGIFSLPVNLHTLNQFFGKRFGPAEARAFVASLGDKSSANPANFEEQALHLIGPDLYQAFIYGYTKKHWGCEPRELPTSIFSRLPIRFDYDDSYHRSRYSGIPRDGYTACIARILDHELVEVKLSTPYEPAMAADFSHVFYTGPLDAWFDHSLGRLSYRTVFWERIESAGDLQGCSQMNYPQLEVPHTRIHEDKHFTPWENHERSVGLVEFAKETAAGDIPYYPKRLAADKEKLAAYLALANAGRGVSFLGRLATYRYMDMHQVIAEALSFSETWLKAFTTRQPLPVFPANLS